MVISNHHNGLVKSKNIVAKLSNMVPTRKFEGGSSKVKTSRMAPQIQKYFCTVYDYAGKADRSMGYWNPERKLGVAGHFLEIIKKRIFEKQ